MALQQLYYACRYASPSAAAPSVRPLVEAYATEAARDAAVAADVRLVAMPFAEISVFAIPVAEIAVSPRIGQPGFEEVVAAVTEDLTDRHLNNPISIIVGRVRYECDHGGQPIAATPMYDITASEPELLTTRAWLWMALGRLIARKDNEKDENLQTSCGSGGN